MVGLEDDDGALNDEYRALQQARLAHEEELIAARKRVEAKRQVRTIRTHIQQQRSSLLKTILSMLLNSLSDCIIFYLNPTHSHLVLYINNFSHSQDVHNRQEAKRRAIAEAEAREAELKRELLDADDDEDLDDLDDEQRMVERKRRFEDSQRSRRDAELARLEEEQRRALAHATDASEAKRLVKEFEANKLAMMRKLASDEDAQRAKLDEALKRRDEARRKAQARANETPEERIQRKTRVMTAIAHGDQPDDEDQLTPRPTARELVIEGEDEEAILAKMAQAEREAYLQRKAEREKDRELQMQRRKDARRKRLEAQVRLLNIV